MSVHRRRGAFDDTDSDRERGTDRRDGSVASAEILPVNGRDSRQQRVG